MYLGTFLLLGNWLTGLCSAFAILTLHLQILQEERFLEAAFGEPYRRYRTQTARYLGRK